jgi:hypothetical protein
MVATLSANYRSHRPILLPEFVVLLEGGNAVFPFVETHEDE